MATTIIIPNNDSPICMQSINAIGKSSSTAPMSLENRLRTRPELLVLKNRIFALLIQRNILSCNVIDARIHILKNDTERMSVIPMVSAVKALYI